MLNVSTEQSARRIAYKGNRYALCAMPNALRSKLCGINYYIKNYVITTMFNEPKPSEIKNWVCVMEHSTEYEIEMAKNYLSNLKIPSNILSKRDSAYNLMLGNMGLVYLYVPQEFEKKARKAIAEWNDAAADSTFEE